MIEQEIQLQLPDEIRPATWWDLAIYIFGGFGLYLGASLLAGLYFSEITLGLLVTASVLNFVCLGGSVFLFGILRKKVALSSMGLFPIKDLLKWAIVGALIAFYSTLVRGVFIYLIELVTHTDYSNLDFRFELFNTGMTTWYGVLLMLLGVGILAPIGEELFFRGLLYDWFKQKFGVEWGIAMSSLLFGLAHYDSLVLVVSTFIMGVVLAFVYERTRTLWTAIFVHITTNSGAVLLMALIPYVEEFAKGLQS